MMISCSSLSLYRNEKKQEYIKQKKGEKILEGRRQEMQQAKKEEKNKKAVEEYERWLVFLFFHFFKTKKIYVVMSANIFLLSYSWVFMLL